MTLPEVGDLVCYEVTQDGAKRHAVVKKYGTKTVTVTTMFLSQPTSSGVYFRGVDIQLHLEDKVTKKGVVKGFRHLDHTPAESIKKRWEDQFSCFAERGRAI